MEQRTSFNSNASINYRRASDQDIKSIKSYLRRESVRFGKLYDKKGDAGAKFSDFNKITILGSGTYGRVFLVKHKSTDNYYAIKVLEKKRVIELQQIEHTMNEKRILQSLNHPFVIYMEFYFSDNSNLYFVLPYISGGEMFGLLRKLKFFPEEQARYYAAQVCLALEYLHSLNLVYRDLKPENILIDKQGNTKITDFGFCKMITGRTYTLCGTPEYLAPEIVLSRGYGKAVDWWAYGILIFEMNSGRPPFRDNNTLLLYDKIAIGKYKVPNHFGISVRDLLSNLLQIDLSKRYGNLINGAADVKEHRYFKQVNWLAMINKKLDAPYIPIVSGPEDTSYFDKQTEQEVRISKEDHYVKEFAEF